MAKKVYKVKGMTCTACARTIEKRLNKLEGINEALVNFATEKLTVEYDAGKVNQQDILNAVKKAGYELIEEDSKTKDNHVKWLFNRFIFSAAFTLPLLYISMGHILKLPLPNFIHPMINRKLFALVQLLFVIPVIIAGKDFYTSGFKKLFLREPNMDSLIAVGTTAAFLYSLYSTIEIIFNNANMVENLYFETTAVIIALISLGKYLEGLSKQKASDAIKRLIELAPKTATVIRDEKEMIISVDEVLIGDIVFVKPGERIPVDGVIIDGHTSIDESMLTGESIPVDKDIGSKVFSGTINKFGAIKFRATKSSKESTLSQIIKLVEEAQSSKAPIAKLADIVSGYFVPIVMVIALFSGVIWYFSLSSFSFSLKIFISVLVIACPCALGLATPTSIIVASGKGAQLGIFFKNAESIEMLSKVNTIVFDKTGTLTQGHPTVSDIVTTSYIDNEEFLKIAASVSNYSEHPLSRAVVNKAKDSYINDFYPVLNFKEYAGKGIEGIIENMIVLIGSRHFLLEHNIEVFDNQEIEQLKSQGKTLVYAAINNNFAGVIGLFDNLKPDAKKTIEKLNSLGIDVYMLTGDNLKTATTIAQSLNIKNVFAEVLPHEKVEKIKKLKEDKKLVAMVGDGINDAPSLSMADVGISLSKATDIAIESADVVLMKDNLLDVVYAISLGRTTMRNIKQNLFWAFFYNVLGIPIAAGVLYPFFKILLNPAIAALAMSFSSVSVVSNALRLKNEKLNIDKI